MPYFEGRKIKNVVEAPTGWVGLEYEENPEIQNEVMHKDEYEAGVSESEKFDRQEVWVKSSQKPQQAMIDAMKEHNVRWMETEALLDWVKESMRQSHNRLLNLVYGVKDWWEELTVDKLGDAPDLDKETADSLAVYLVLKERKVKFKDVPQIIQGAVNMVNRKQVQNIERELGKPMRFLRLDDIEQYAEMKESQSETYADPKTDAEGV